MSRAATLEGDDRGTRPPGLPDRWARWRNRLLASPRFQRWAARFPLTRPIARRRAQGLFDLCAGFVYAQVLFACVRLRLFQLLDSEGPLTVAELAPRLSMPLDGTERLLRAARALGLVEVRGAGRYGLGPQGAVVLGNPGIAAMVEHHAMLYADLADPVALLRDQRSDTELGRYWPYANTDDPDALAPERVAAYSALMAESQPMVAAEVVDAYPLHRHRRLLDVGGGDGVFLRAVAKAAPGLELMLFDLPAVAGRARQQFADAGLSARVAVHGGDFFADPLPEGADIVTLVRILHDHDETRVLRLLERVRTALPPGGVVLVAEPMAETPGAETVGDAYFGLYLKAMGRGRPRTPGENAALLRQAGFEAVRQRKTSRPFLTCVIQARRPVA
jgi:demethylspheroidene O-methyltransferase